MRSHDLNRLLDEPGLAKQAKRKTAIGIRVQWHFLKPELPWFVIPAKAGIQRLQEIEQQQKALDASFRWHDDAK